MAVDVNQLADQDNAFMQQAAEARNAQHAQEALQNGEKPEPSFLQRWVTGPMGRVGTSMLDAAVSTADSYFNSDAGHKARDVVSGAMTGATNIADAAGSALRASGEGMAKAEDPDHADAVGAPWPTSPIWDHAKSAILDFRDAVAVQDPTLADNLVQGAAQLAIPFAGYSRVLAGIHGIANMALAGAATDATALGPHDPRMADILALGKHVDGKIGETLRTLAPDGSALNAYINYLSDRGDESEAEGRFKNVLDGFGVNMIATPLIHTAASVVKQGTAGLRYAIENGVGSASELTTAATQRGMIAFHGTAADFDHFDESKIGTGEGNQTFGHGLYFAENPETAGHYRSMLERRNVPAGSPMDNALVAVKRADGNSRDAYQTLVQKAAKAQDPAQRENFLKAADMIKAGNAKPRGNVMHAEIADEHVSSMIDWDQPIAAQPNLQKALQELNVKIEPEGNKFRVNVNGKPGPMYLTRAAAMSETDLLRGESHNVNAGMAYQQLSEALRSDKAASEYLSSKGIPGIKYLDQGSRDKGGGTRNLVLFDAKHAKIVAKNGKPVEGAARTDMSLSPEERALERERVAALRDRAAGVTRDVEPEPIPANAAEREGAAMRRRKGDK